MGEFALQTISTLFYTKNTFTALLSFLERRIYNGPHGSYWQSVMKNVMARFSAAGMRVDGKLVSETVKKELTAK